MRPHSSQWDVGVQKIKLLPKSARNTFVLPLPFLHACAGLPAGPERGGAMAAAAAALRSDRTERPERPAIPRLLTCAACFGKYSYFS